MMRGPQFPLVNEQHFNGERDYLGGRTHTSQHGEYTVEHTYHDGEGGGYGIVRVSHPRASRGMAWDRTHAPGVVASLKYDLETVSRATSLRPQPLTHTEYIDVDHEHRGRGLTGVMQSVLQRAHPGAPNIASNELTGEGAQWRSHMAKTLRDPGMGQRIGYNEELDDLAVYRPDAGQPRDALVRDSGLYDWGNDDSRAAKGKWPSRG